MYDNVRTFRHDFFNIMQSIDGYIKTGDVASLNSYYNEIKSECDNLNSLSVLDPELIDDYAIYNLITNKYYKSLDMGISFEIHFLAKLSTLNITPYVLSRILGILLDNAIEASSNSEEKKIILEVVPLPGFDASKHIANIIIQNSYSNKDVNLDRIYEKGFNSKTNTTRFSWTWSLECHKNYKKI